MPRSFPTWRDLAPVIPSRDEVERALEQLRQVVEAGLADIYTAAGSHGDRWNIWFERPAWRLPEQRVELLEWATVWLDVQRPPAGGDAK